MSERKINLEEILTSESKKELGNYKWIDFDEVYKQKSFNELRKFIIGFGKTVAAKTLELAAENAETSFEPIIGFHVCPGDGDYVVNKQSILDTMNFIE